MEVGRNVAGLEPGPDKLATAGEQLKGWFRKQPAQEPPASQHWTHGERENEQLAVMIGQLQHLIDTANLPTLPPLIEQLDGVATNIVDYLPSFAHTITGIQVSTDTAFILTASVLGHAFPQGAKVIARVVCPVGVSQLVPLAMPVPPTDCQIQLAVSAAPAHASVHVLLQAAIAGRYPYAG